MTNPRVISLPPENAAHAVALSLFGSFRLLVDGKVVDSFHSNKTRALLAYLLIEGRQPVLRTLLTELFWPGYTDESARTNLRQTLTSLRQSLAPFALLHADRSHVQLDIDPTILYCDALHFVGLLDACQYHAHRTLAQCTACQAYLQQAIALYQGGFLENFPEVDSLPFNHWLHTQRTRFADLFAEAKAALVPPVVRHGNLPPPLTPLIGRGCELAKLTQHLHHPIYRCVSLVGAGGIGKTRLACAVSEPLQWQFADGVWLVELNGLAPTTEAETLYQLQDRLATAIATTIGLTFYGITRPAAQVATYLTDKTALLILDSFEHLAAGAAWLPTLLKIAPQLRLLITTRHRLSLQSQIVYQVNGLEVPPDLPLTGAEAEQLTAQVASVQLFMERAESAQLALPRDTSTLAAIRQLCHFVDGSPWAIEVAVSMLDRYTPVALFTALQGNYRTLATTLLDLPARQRSAEAVFLTAWQLLTPEEAQTLAHCSVFRGGFTLEAAQTVAAATPATLEALMQKSLLRRGDGDRYTMHDLVRQFAGERLMLNATAAERTRAAHADYFTALLATWQPDDDSLKHFRDSVMQNWDNVQAAWAWAVETGNVFLLQQGLDGLAEFYNLVELFLEADVVLNRTIDRVRLLLKQVDAFGATTADNHALQALLAHLLWRHCYFVNDALAETARAEPLAQELITLAHELEDGALIARGYYELAIVAHFQGDSQHEAQLLQQALPLAQQHGTIYDQIVCLNLLGLNCRNQNDPTLARRYFQQALTLTQHGTYTYYDLMVLNNMGYLLIDTGYFSAALIYLQQSLSRATSAALKSKIAFALASIGDVSLLVGDYADAHLRLTEAHQRYCDLHDNYAELEVLNMLAMLFAEEGDDATAQNYCQRVLMSPGSHIYLVRHRALCTLGYLYQNQDKWEAAADLYQQALSLSQGVKRKTDELLCQTYLASVTLELEGAAAALASVESLLANFASTLFVPQQRPQTLLLIAYKVLAANQDPRAASVLHQAWDYIQTQADKIDDPRLRHSFLTHVPVNRTIRGLMGIKEECALPVKTLQM